MDMLLGGNTDTLETQKAVFLSLRGWKAASTNTQQVKGTLAACQMLDIGCWMWSMDADAQCHVISALLVSARVPSVTVI